MDLNSEKRPRRTAPYSDEHCPLCLAKSPCVDWQEVDIGVGTQTWNPEFQCPTHGLFAWAERTVEQIAAGEPARAIFADDELAAKGPAREDIVYEDDDTLVLSEDAYDRMTRK